MTIISGLTYEYVYINGKRTNYIVTSKGIVCNIVTEKIMKQHKNEKGYLTVSLTINKKTKSYKVHRLVANAFITNHDNKPTVNHIDCNKNNNNVTNLEWATQQEQIDHVFENKLRTYKTCEEHPSSFYTNNQINEVCKHLVDNILTIKDISKITNVDEQIIRDIKNNRAWTGISKMYDFSKYDKYRKVERYPSDMKNKISNLILEGLSTNEIIKKMSLKKTPKLSCLIYDIRRKIKDMSSTTTES